MQKFRFLIDEKLGHDVKDVYELNLAGADDEAIKERRTLITLDNDFGNIYFSNIGKFGVIIVNLETFLKSDMKNIDLSKDLVIQGRKIRVIKGF